MYTPYLLGHPDLIREVLVTQSRKFAKGPLDKQILGKMLGNGLLTSDGDFHKRQRRLAQPAFHSKRIQNYAEVMVDYTNDIMANWQNSAVVNVADEMMHLTMLIVSKTLFDADSITGDGETAVTIGNAMHDFQARLKPRLSARVFAPQLAAHSRQQITESRSGRFWPGDGPNHCRTSPSSR